MYSLEELTTIFNRKLGQYSLNKEPSTLYEPIAYIMSLGGKRIRPVLTMAGYNIFKSDVENVFEAGLAFEMFHNFSLVHDDIMDDADIRRGQESTHIKFGENAAILSGDAMMIMSYKLLERYQDDYLKLTQLFSKTALEVCEGQRFDMDFEDSNEVTIPDYLNMISLKTSVLIAAALQTGAMIAGASESDAKHLYEFGKNVGIAFQIQDDILDTFGDQAKFGKRIGGDIIQSKKTYLYLKSLELLSREEATELKALYENTSIDENDKIDRVKALFNIAHVRVHAEELKLVYQQLAFSHLDAVAVDEEKKKVLRTFAEELLNRSS